MVCNFPPLDPVNTYKNYPNTTPPPQKEPVVQRASGTLNENICKTRELGTGEMAHQFRALGALPKDLDLVPRTYIDPSYARHRHP